MKLNIFKKKAKAAEEQQELTEEQAAEQTAADELAQAAEEELAAVQKAEEAAEDAAEAARAALAESGVKVDDGAHIFQTARTGAGRSDESEEDRPVKFKVTDLNLYYGKFWALKNIDMEWTECCSCNFCCREHFP